MPGAIPNNQRREIVASREAGESFVSIARRLKLSYEGVRQIYHRYEREGRLTPAYERCAHKEVRHVEAIYSAAIGLKEGHPSWGAGLIWVELGQQFATEELPSVRTLQRWFRRAKVQPKTREQVAKVSVQRGQAGHEVWAIDAKEQMRLRDGSYVSWLTVTDEGSGAILDATLFPHETLESTRSDASQGESTGNDGSLGTTPTNADG